MRLLSEYVRGRWKHGDGAFGSPWRWRGQTVTSDRYYSDGFAVVDGAALADVNPLLDPMTVWPYGKGEVTPVPEAKAATALADAAANATSPARLTAAWGVGPEHGESLYALRFDGPNGPAADVSFPRFVAVAAAVGAWDRATSDAAGRVVLWRAGAPIALFFPLALGLPPLTYSMAVAGGPPRPGPPPPPRPPLRKAPRLEAEADRAAWVLRAAGEVLAHFGGRQFGRTPLRTAHWAVPARGGVLRITLERLVSGTGWVAEGSLEPFGAPSSRPVSLTRPDLLVVARWDEVPERLAEAIELLFEVPPGDRPSPADLTPPPAPGEKYRIVEDGGRWAIVDAHRGTAPQPGRWLSIAHAKAAAHRMNVAAGMADPLRPPRLFARLRG